MTVLEAKREYNKLLKRYYDGCKYFDRKDIPQTEKEKFLPHFKKVLSGLNYLLGKVGIYTGQEVLEGFHD